jgi:hypothetical protein
MLAGSYLALLEAIDIYTQETVTPVVQGLLNPSQREQIVAGLYYRSIGFCRTACELKHVVHQQALTSAERSVIELFVDMALIHNNIVDKGVERFLAFTDSQKLKAARRMDAFYIKYPALDSNPSHAAPHRAFIVSDAARVEAERELYWGKDKNGKPIKPEHWSGMDLVTRSMKLGKEIEYLVTKDYDRRNFSVHTGLAGFLNLSKENFEAMCAIALKLIGESMLSELHILGSELRLDQAIPNYQASLAIIDTVQTYSFADRVLQSQGAKQRYWLHRGDPPLVQL